MDVLLIYHVTRQKDYSLKNLKNKYGDHSIELSCLLPNRQKLGKKKLNMRKSDSGGRGLRGRGGWCGYDLI